MIQDEIKQAISAHGKWKHKLRSIIDSGESDVTASHVKADNNCSFGKWLHGRINPNEKGSPHYAAVVQLHAEFHQEAAKILELGLKGDKDAANAAMALTSPFSQISAKLTQELNKWLDSLG